MSSMKPFKKLISRKDAIAIILKTVSKIKRKEKISIENVSRRILAENIIAKLNVPPFNRSAMDGYAVKAEDTFGASGFNPIKLKLVGVQHAGEQWSGEIKHDECVQVATGSPVPGGSNSVVMVEYTKLDGSFVEILKPVYPKANISPEGEDLKEGDLVLESGEVLSPAKIGVLAALNIQIVTVLEKPKVGVYSTGTEIIPLGTDLEPSQIYDVNSYTMASVISSMGCIPIRHEIVGDEREAIEAAIKQASKYDLGVFSGGSSVGVRDLFAEVIEDLGEIFFHGVQVKPGKPTLFGEVNSSPIFGMPGYPTSCLSNSYIFLAPALKKIAGLPNIPPIQVKAKMGQRFVSSSGREQFLTVKIEHNTAIPVFKKSGDITSMASADGYIILPVNLDVIEEGEEVTVTLLS